MSFKISSCECKFSSCESPQPQQQNASSKNVGVLPGVNRQISNDSEWLKCIKCIAAVIGLGLLGFASMAAMIASIELAILTVIPIGIALGIFAVGAISAVAFFHLNPKLDRYLTT